MAWFNFSIAAYDTGRGTEIIEADSYEEALAKLVATKAHHNTDLSNDGEYEGHRIVDCIRLDTEDQDVKTGECVAEDAAIPGEDEYYNAFDDFRKEAFHIVGSATGDRQAEILALLRMPPGLVMALKRVMDAYHENAGTPEAAKLDNALDAIDDLMDGKTAAARPTTKLDLAKDLLNRIKPNTDLEIVIGTLKGVLEAQGIREKIKRDFQKGRT